MEGNKLAVATFVLIVLNCLSLGTSSYVKLLQHCGQQLDVSKVASYSGIISLNGADKASDRTCRFTLKKPDADVIVYVRLIGIDFKRCDGATIAVTELADKKYDSYEVFTSRPYFCGKRVWISDASSRILWSGSAPYQFDVTGVDELESSDQVLFEFSAATKGQMPSWPTSISDPSLKEIVTTMLSNAVMTTLQPQLPTATEPREATTAPNITTTALNTTTSSPNITTTAPNTTTMAPNATTMAPNTTTTAPNTPTTSPNTTTTAPNTTTTAPNTTTIVRETTTTAELNHTSSPPTSKTAVSAAAITTPSTNSTSVSPSTTASTSTLSSTTTTATLSTTTSTSTSPSTTTSTSASPYTTTSTSASPSTTTSTSALSSTTTSTSTLSSTTTSTTATPSTTTSTTATPSTTTSTTASPSTTSASPSTTTSTSASPSTTTSTSTSPSTTTSTSASPSTTTSTSASPSTTTSTSTSPSTTTIVDATNKCRCNLTIHSGNFYGSWPLHKLLRGAPVSWQLKLYPEEVSCQRASDLCRKKCREQVGKYFKLGVLTRLSWIQPGSRSYNYMYLSDYACFVIDATVKEAVQFQLSYNTQACPAIQTDGSLVDNQPGVCCRKKFATQRANHSPCNSDMIIG